MKALALKPVASFQDQLAAYKQAIDADIAAYRKHVLATTAEQYGEYAALITDVYFDILSRGGKRLRGSLVMTGYEMCGGRDQTMIVRAATAMEMLHAYMLIIDDIQDRSTLRRGKPAAHEMLAAYHRRHHLRGDSMHAGVSLGLNAALSGAHAAHMLLAGLSVPDEYKVKVLGIVNLTMVITAHGQTYDIMNEIQPEVPAINIDRALEWKTAHYTFLNPLCVGMVLAGAGCEDTNAIRDYALSTGKAFQIADDIAGVFGKKTVTGKGAGSDIVTGKRTLLITHALAQAEPADKHFLNKCLGNSSLSAANLDRCRRIIMASGALDYAREIRDGHIAQALEALHIHQRRWPAGNVRFLRQLAQQLTKEQGFLLVT